MNKKYSRVLSVILVSLIWNFGCMEPDYPDSVWQEDEPTNPNPVITSVTPPDRSFEGVGIVTIEATNLSSSMSENLVFFNGRRATIDTTISNETQLVVQVPVVIEDPAVNVLDSVIIRVAVHGAYLFSEYPDENSPVDNFRLERAAVNWGGFKGKGDNDQDPRAMACDSEENLYVSTYDGAEKLIYKVSPEGEISAYGPATASVVTGMVIGPGDTLYYARNYKYIYTIPPGGGSTEKFNTAKLPGSGKAFALDFDEKGLLWAAGKGDYSVFYLKPDATPTASEEYVDFEFVAIRVYDGYVYVAGKYVGDDATVSKEGIWRSQIQYSDTSLSTKELVFDWESFVGESGPAIQSITFDEDGDIYIGAREKYAVDGSYEGGDAVTILNTSSMTTNVLYSSILFAPATHIVWGNSNYLYISRHTDNPQAENAPEKQIIRVALDKNGAPYYGRL